MELVMLELLIKVRLWWTGKDQLLLMCSSHAVHYKSSGHELGDSETAGDFWTEMAVAYFKVAFQHFHARDSLETPKNLRYSASGKKFEHAVCGVRDRRGSALIDNLFGEERKLTVPKNTSDKSLH
jgi:hypothetical protein